MLCIIFTYYTYNNTIAELKLKWEQLKGNEWNSQCNIQSQNYLEHLDILMVPTRSLKILEYTEGSMAEHHRLVSHPWIYTYLLIRLIHWNLKKMSSRLKSQIEELTGIIIITPVKYLYNGKWDIRTGPGHSASVQLMFKLI